MNDFPTEAIVLEVEPGEESKSLITVSNLTQQLLAKNFSRHGLLIALGGGMITDLGGFFASIYKRGISSVYVPTTLLCMVDAAFGGKTGINHSGIKNCIGTFYPPVAIYLNMVFLSTLPEREYKSGWVEMVKHLLISGKLEQIDALEQKLMQKTVGIEDILRSIEIKQSIVTSDPKESGRRKILNFGHTIGHAMETLFIGAKNELLHGEAVAWGMLAEANLSFRRKLITNETFQQIQNLIRTHFTLPKLASNQKEKLLQFMRNDKKNNRKIAFSLIKDAAEAAWDIFVEEDEILEILDEIFV